MKFMIRLAIAAYVLPCTVPMASAQSPQTLVGLGNIILNELARDFPNQVHIETTHRCVNKRWMKTVTVTLDLPIIIDTYTDTTDDGPCPCPAQSQGETNCNSSGTNGQNGSYDNSAAAGASSMSSSGGPQPNLVKFGRRGSPAPMQNAHQDVPQRLDVMQQPLDGSHASAGTASFTYTLPYRVLGAAGLTNASLPTNFSPACNSQISPTMLMVAHIDATVTRSDLCTSALLATIHVNPLPLQIRVTPDGTQAIVTHYQNAISFIDLSSNTVSAVINTDPSFTPSGIAISPDGSYALVTNYEAPPDAYLAVVDLSTRKITSTIPLDTAYPQSVFINPDATLAWVTFPWNESVEVVDLLTGARVASFFLDTPYSVAFNPTGTMAYLAGGEAIGTVEVIDASSYTLVKTIPAGAGAGDLQVDPGEAFVSVNNAFGGSVTVFNPQTFSSTTIPVGGSPRGAVRVPIQ